jgi:predicted Zn-dependent protease with MMP-like domain
MPPEMDPSAEPAESAESAESAAESADLDEFDRLVLAAVDSLPQEFRDRLGTVAIVIEEEASPYQLASAGAPGLFGLYTGVPRTAWGADDAPLASKITIFRGPHLRHYRDPDALARGVADTVRHEVAHHFGISDARLDELARERHRH